MQGEHFRNTNPEGFPVRGGQQGPGLERQGEGQGHGSTVEGRREAEE